MADHLGANRRLWNEWAGINARSELYDVEAFKLGGVRLRPYELEEVGDVVGKDLLHLQCHLGLDSLSWARLGANVTGADFSEASIGLARSLAEELQIPARFVVAEVSELPSVLEGDFDVVYASRGVLSWLPDLNRWADVVAHFLRPGGFFYITDAHPVLWVFDDDEAVRDLRFRYPYFHRDEPLEFPVQGSYADPTAAVKQPVEYSWVHDMGELITAVARTGLHIEFLHEFPFVSWPAPFLEPHPEDRTWQLPQDDPAELPLFFSLKATRLQDGEASAA